MLIPDQCGVLPRWKQLISVLSSIESAGSRPSSLIRWFSFSAVGRGQRGLVLLGLHARRTGSGREGRDCAPDGSAREFSRTPFGSSLRRRVVAVRRLQLWNCVHSASSSDTFHRLDSRHLLAPKSLLHREGRWAALGVKVQQNLLRLYRLPGGDVEADSRGSCDLCLADRSCVASFPIVPHARAGNKEDA